MDYEEYINLENTDATLPTRNKISQGIEAYVTENFDAETSRINRNAWRLRFDLDINNHDHLVDIIETINQLVRSTDADVHLTWKAITTDTNGQKNGFTHLGRWGEQRDQLTERQYPIEALDVSVDR